MAQSKNRLGRGLGGLISGGGVARPNETQEIATPETKVKAKGEGKGKATPSSSKGTKGNSPIPAQSTGLGYQEIALGKIKANPYQPRREIAEKQVKELAQSIQSEGLLQPIVVRSTGKGYELIAGERRLRAFKFLKSKTIPCRVIEASDASSASLALIENLQRENLNPIDEALGYASLVRDFDLTQEAAADRVGKGRATVANALRLLSLSEEIQGFLSRRLLSTGHAKVLLGVKDDAQQHLLARRIIESNLSVREAEKIVKRLNEGLEPSDGLGSGNDNSGKTSSRAENTAIADLEKRIEKHFNTNVSIQHGKKKGKLVIEYFGNEDLDRLLELLGINQR
ncbi:MAG: ParB/RepB/Spo0J family partition protein [Coraliomargaritaceae bacterium]|jgi:ParB family chromosome partitioning protein